MPKTTIMENEARSAPEKIAHQLKQNQELLINLSEKIRHYRPQYVITIGRGSSDHACTYAKYLFETQLNLITASAAPSVVTVYNAKPNMQKALVIGISQSGQSPDICKMMEVARRSGAITVAIVNAEPAKLAQIAEFVIPMHVGPETAVAATKSYLGSLTAIAQLIATLSQEKNLLAAIPALPTTLTAALDSMNNAQVIRELQTIDRTFIIARGFGFPIAQEAALKFKETAGIQAEAFSAAEILHGPFALIRKDQPFLLFAQNDATLKDILDISKRITELGGKAILAIPQNLLTQSTAETIASLVLPLPKSLHPILDPIVAIQSFYPMVARLAVARGLNPDVPQYLKKVTETF